MKKILTLLLILCKAISYLSACIHYILINARFVNMPSLILINNNGVFYNLQNIWYAHFVRKVISVLLRTPFKLSVLNLVCTNIQLPTNVGCVIAICHTPWKRLLVEWSLHHDFGLIIAGEKWNAKSRQIQRQGKTYHDLKSILSHLKQKGRVIIAFDRYSNYNDCKVDFLGECLNLPVLPIRLAKKARVPIITVIPVLSSGLIKIIPGPRFEPDHLEVDPRIIMQKLSTFLENEIKNNPAIWTTSFCDSILKPIPCTPHNAVENTLQTA